MFSIIIFFIFFQFIAFNFNKTLIIFFNIKKRHTIRYVISPLEPLIRIELMTYWLQVSCSTIWATVAMVTHTGFEPMSPPWKGDVLTPWPMGQQLLLELVSYPRLERGTPWLKVKCSTDWANSPCCYSYIIQYE